VAVFPSPAGGKSYVTSEQCVGPIITDSPVITHVSVEETDHLDGNIRVSWRSPFNIDKTLFPEPYQYHIYRGDGFLSSNNSVKISEVMVDTTFLDEHRNTTDSVYNYQLVVYSKPDGYSNFIAVDTSFTASSARLIANSGSAKIQLEWSAEVPWSNVIDGSPFHYIYRGSKDDANLAYLGKADITKNGFMWDDETVNPNEYYCYTIMTRGTYGNPEIDTLRNFSQRVCLYPINNLMPCPPIVSIDQTNCDDFLMSSDCDIEFKNSLSWILNDETGCRVDVESYNIYSSMAEDSDFELIQGGLTNLSYTDIGLPSFARCYKITAIDSQGQESELSEAYCNDN
jgi:hypothetical protein